jgi:DNA-binding response OmpR family regulator
MKVLVVDSDEVAGTATARGLSSSHKVRLVPTVSAALRAIEEARPDAVICEVALTGGECGDVLLSWLRAHHPTIRRIVFARSALPSSLDVDAAHAWVLKPDVPRLLWLLRGGGD